MIGEDESQPFPQEFADELWRRGRAEFVSIGNRDRSWHELLAHHEAGHIVAAWVLRATLGGVGVLPYGLDGDRPAGGQALFFIGSQGGMASVAHVIAVMAGPAAARRFDCRQDDGGVYDREDVTRSLAAMCRSPEASAIVRAHCEAEARRLVAENWDAIEAVAAALLEHETLDSAQLADVFGEVECDRANARKAQTRRSWRQAEINAAAFAALCTEMKR